MVTSRKEYSVEKGLEVRLPNPEAKFMPEDIYREMQKGIVISCHDILANIDGGILLAERLIEPAKGVL